MKKAKTNDQDGKQVGKQHSTAGICNFLGEHERVSKTPGFAFFCTPGHNRGAAYNAEEEAVEILLVTTENVQ
jgi:hypothetical protein